jgi:peptidoglycan/xylan/chitin deacetylase (PgdA/CDA1 family)
LRLNNRTLAIIFAVLFVAVSIFIYLNRSILQNIQVGKSSGSKFAEILKSPSATPTPTPTPKPLTFAEMNALYGPCVQLPTFMYHHVQTRDVAISNHQISLTVNTDIFKTQMQYLKDKNYNTLTMNDLINFFDNGTAVPKHSLLLTFDDGYQDFYTDAYPILSSLGFHATMFVPTGLMNNPGYLSWDEISGMNGPVLFANHTWSHKSVVTQTAVMEKEISTADTQLADHSLNSPKVFAYPYGPDSIASESYLNSLGYKAAFTTKPGSILCKKQRFDLPRIRVGNLPLSSYGF